MNTPPFLLKKNSTRMLISFFVLAAAVALIGLFPVEITIFVVAFYFTKMVFGFLTFSGLLNSVPMSVFKLPHSVISACMFVMQTKEYKEWAAKQGILPKKESK